MRWLITNRNRQKNPDTFGGDLDDVTYWTYDPAAKPGSKPEDTALFNSWTKVTLNQFKTALKNAASAFPDPQATLPEKQKHVTLFVHGYKNSWAETMGRYETIASELFDGADSLGELVCFDWPSKGSLLGYLPDRASARKTGDDLTDVLEELYDWMADMQAAAADNPANACKAKTSIIAHSMGNYALQYAMNQLWTRKNQPLLVSLMQEVVMVAADVDNDIFRSGETVTHGDGEGLANMSYRITALYTGRDDVLGASAGLKHFGKRRLGRAGLDDTYPLPDNVWDIDCTDLIDKSVNGIDVHGAYFDPDPKKAQVYPLLRGILEGTDRSILIKRGSVPTANTREQVTA